MLVGAHNALCYAVWAEAMANGQLDVARAALARVRLVGRG